MKLTLAALLALVSLPAAPLAAQQPRAAPPAEWPAFVRRFDALADSDRVVGASVVVARGGRVLARHDYGLADRERAQRVDARTLFHYGSITKTLTAIAVLQLRDRGRLGLDDPVVRWIPELRQVHDPYGAIDSVTIRMLLSHASGFQNPTWPWSGGHAWEPFEPTRWEQLVAMMPYMELRFRPGSRFGYSNPGYVYLARIVELVTGDPWESYVQKNILTPLGLERSYFRATPYWLAADRSNNYTVVRDSASGRDSVVANGREFDPGITVPNSGWNAPLADLVAYAGFLAGAGRADTAVARRQDAVLARATLAEMWRPAYPTGGVTAGVTPSGAAQAEGNAIGLGFFVFTRGGTTVVGHTGSQAGFRSFLYLEPASGTAVIGVVNTSDDAEEAASSRRWDGLMEAAIGLTAGVTADRRSSSRAPNRP